MLTSCSLQEYVCAACMLIATDIFITVKLATRTMLLLFTFTFLSFMLTEKSYGDEKLYSPLLRDYSI